MRTSLIRGSSLAALFASLGLAAVPVASVTSAQPFSLDGTVVSNPGVNSWPVVVNDEVSTFDRGGAILNFQDGSRIDISASSRVQVQGTDSNPRIVLLAGKMNYNIVPGSRVAVLALTAQQQPPTDTQTGAGQPADKKKKKQDEGAVPPDTLSRQTQVLRWALPIAFIGLGLATDAILQQGSASPR